MSVKIAVLTALLYTESAAFLATLVLAALSMSTSGVEKAPVLAAPAMQQHRDGDDDLCVNISAAMA